MTARFPRLALVAAVVLLGGGSLTYAAVHSLAPAATPVATTPLVQQHAVLVVPDVRGQAFVFAKGALQDAGFSWRVVGAVRGYPANKVAAQSVPPGTRVLDNGAPQLVLTLARAPKYAQQGTPEDISPYRATKVVLTDAAGQPLLVRPGGKPKAHAKAPAPAKAAAPAAPPASTTAAPAAPAAPAATTPAGAPAAPAAPGAPKAPAPAAPTHAAAKPSRYPQVRPPAFAVAGAPKEPLDEMPLVERASALGRWLSSHPKPTDSVVKHWLYQNEWIVTGARFGWWRGAEALRVLIGVDRRAVALWGIGSKSEAVARGALAEVEARSR